MRPHSIPQAALMQMVYFQKGREDAVTLGLPIETFFTQPLQIHFGCAYLEERCASPDAMADEAWRMSILFEEAVKEKEALQCVFDVLQGNLTPMLG
jgi:hypothetical protein